MSIILRELDDQQQTGSTPQLQLFTAGSSERYQLVRELVFRITLSINNTGAPATWTTLDWRRNSYLKSFFKVSGNNSAVVHVDNVPLQQLGALATVEYDGSLDTADTEIPDTVALSAGVADYTVTLRIPLRIETMIRTGDDCEVQLAEIGQQLFSFGNANFGAGIAIQQIRVQAYARVRPCKSLRVGLFSRIEQQVCRAPQPKDSIQCSANERIAYLALVSSDTPSSPVTGATFPIVSQNGQPIIEGNRMATVATIGQLRGEAFYPQGPNSQTTYAPDEYAFLIQPDPYSKTSELVGGDSIDINYTANSITAGRAFYTVHKVLALDPAQAAIRSGRDLDSAQRAVANAGKPFGASTMLFVPVEF